jgi:lipopolysaccharide/colanic/teichoic acid biosynthesis glycosyltransferase
MPSAQRRLLMSVVSAPRLALRPIRPRPRKRPGSALVQSQRKRAFDLLLACILVVAAAPVGAAIAIIIRLTSSGPVLFRQRRLGLDGIPFTMLKFRTMYQGVSPEAHERFVTEMIASPPVSSAGAIHKLRQDARVTRVGRWLRRTSLDELPQLINVLKGEMSIVGPRPPVDYEVAKYEPWQWGRLAVRPGITGLWQVSGRNRLTYHEMCETDIRYIDEWSLMGDLKIVVRTPWIMFVDGGGAE